MKNLAYGEEEPEREVDVTDVWFEKNWASGSACRLCGSQFGVPELHMRHIAWHESMGQKPDGV